jgi:hypothetical protein
MKKIILIFIAFFLLHNSYAQLFLVDDSAGKKPIAKEFAIPTSPLFDLMGQAPSQVARTSDIKDFKVDWSFKNWKLNPNIAIQAQPIWEIFYNKKSIKKYQAAKPIARTLASIDMSVGTVQTETNDRRIGGALKMNLYKQKDALLRKGVYDEIEKDFLAELKKLKATEKEILKHIDTVYKPSELEAAKLLLRANDNKLATYYLRRNAAIQEKASEFLADNWNKAFVDVAYGQVYTYKTDSAGSLKKLALNRNTGNGLWMNFGFGIGKRGLVSGLIRSTFYEEALSFTLTDNATGNITPQTAIAENRIFTVGINFRYGGPIFNFFVEFVHEAKQIKNPIVALQENFTTPTGQRITGGKVDWLALNPYQINIGGDWRLSRNVVLNYGIQALYDNKFKKVSFTPVANISCMMR